jgi:hypothetical protein
MRVFLRTVAGLTIVPVVFTILLLLRHWQLVGLLPLPSIDAIGRLFYLSWLVIAFLGPFAIVQLWRLRPSGRIAGAIVWGDIALHQLGLLCFRIPHPLVSREMLFFGFSAILLVGLLMPASRRVGPSAEPATSAPPTH